MKDGLAFNRKDPGEQHIVTRKSHLAAHIRLRSEYNSKHRTWARTPLLRSPQTRRLRGSTEHMVPLCITIRARRAGPTTCRASDILFSSEDVLHRVFAALLDNKAIALAWIFISSELLIQAYTLLMFIAMPLKIPKPTSAWSPPVTFSPAPHGDLGTTT